MSGKRLLILAWQVPPGLSAVSTVVGNLATQFAPEEVLLAGDAPGAGEPTDAENCNVPVVFLRRPLQRRGDNTARRLLAPLLALRAHRVCKEHGCSCILTVFPDEAYLFAGWFAARLGKRNFYPYFHNTYLENRRGASKVFARFLQSSVFRDAKHVFVMSQGMVELYRRNYPTLTRCSPLVHTFTEPLPEPREPQGSGPQLKFGFCGTINESCLDAARRMFAAARKISNATVQFCTRLKPDYLQRIGVWSDRSKHCSPGRKQLLEILSSTDILLLPHGFKGRLAAVEYETIFPTKTIEYLISGRPILAHSPPGVFLTRFLKEHECALVVEEPSEAALVQAIERLRSDGELRARLVRNALKTARMFQASVVAQHLRDVLAASAQ